MASNLRRSKRTVGKRISEINRRVTRLQKKSAPTSIAPGTVTNNVLSTPVIETISTAQATADGKNAIYYQDDAPSGSSLATGDLWFDSNNGYALSKWNGTAWESFGLGNAAFSNIDAGKITAGILNSIQINAGTPVSGNYPFSVSTAGVLRAVSGTVGAFTLSTSTLTAANLPSGVSGISSSIELATNGQIKTRIDNASGPYYVEVYVNKSNSDGGIEIVGNASGTIRSSVMTSSYVYSGGSVRHGDITSDDKLFGAGSHTRVGAGDGLSQNYSFRVVNGTNLYDQPLTTTRKQVYMNSNSTLGYDGSSIRFKQNIEPLEIDYAKVLMIQPVTFLFKEEVAAVGQKNAAREPGVIAEQVEEVGLASLVTRDSGGAIDGFRYDRLPVFLLEVCRKQEEKIDNLEARLSALEN